MSKKILELNDVTMQFGGVKALDTVNFHVNEGEICALIGPNGAEKQRYLTLLLVFIPRLQVILNLWERASLERSALPLLNLELLEPFRMLGSLAK